MKRARLSDWLAWTLLFALAGCGFHFRGSPEMPFASLYVVTTNYSSFSAELKRYLASGKKGNVVERAEDAEVILEIMREASEKQVLSISNAGRVREFELRYRVLYRLTDRAKREWIPPTELLLRRDLTFDDRELLAKENEEGLLLRDMRNDAMRLILRRLSKAKPPATT